MPVKKNDPNRRVKFGEYEMDRKGNLYSPANDDDTISVTAKEIDQVMVRLDLYEKARKAQNAANKAQDYADKAFTKAELSQSVVGTNAGHAVDFGAYRGDGVFHVGCHEVYRDEAIRIHKLSRKLRGLK